MKTWGKLELSKRIHGCVPSDLNSALFSLRATRVKQIQTPRGAAGYGKLNKNLSICDRYKEKKRKRNPTGIMTRSLRHPAIERLNYPLFQWWDILGLFHLLQVEKSFQENSFLQTLN